METFGFFYITAYFIDACFAFLATFFPMLEVPGAIFDTTILAIGTPIILFSALGKLRPRKVYLTLALMKIFSFAVAIVVVVILVSKVGQDKMPEILSSAFMEQHLSWFYIYNWISMIIGGALATYGLTSILARRKKLKAETGS